MGVSPDLDIFFQLGILEVSFLWRNSIIDWSIWLETGNLPKWRPSVIENKLLNDGIQSPMRASFMPKIDLKLDFN